jgi:imidazolonepropionase-like amidohydrolase
VADFLVLKENPLDHIETLMDLDQVYKKGRSVLK